MSYLLSGLVTRFGLLPLPEGPDEVGDNQRQVDDDANRKKADRRLVLLGRSGLGVFAVTRLMLAHWG